MGKSGNPGKRPVQDGLPVPWVARRQDELPYPAENIRMAQVAPGEVWANEWALLTVDPPHYRDSRDVWWMSYMPGRNGRWLFASLSPDRQRQCFDERRCQFCGRIIRETLHWLIEQRHLQDRTTNPTAHAPLHSKCIELATRYCPHWRRTPYVVLASDEFEAIGVYGDVLDVRGGVPGFTESANVRFTDPRIMRVIAKQLIVTINNYEEVERRGR
jgi:hypothetical protein